jgi:hypothetical protein
MPEHCRDECAAPVVMGCDRSPCTEFQRYKKKIARTQFATSCVDVVLAMFSAGFGPEARCAVQQTLAFADCAPSGLAAAEIITTT